MWDNGMMVDKRKFSHQLEIPIDKVVGEMQWIYG